MKENGIFCHLRKMQQFDSMKLLNMASYLAFLLDMAQKIVPMCRRGTWIFCLLERFLRICRFCFTYCYYAICHEILRQWSMQITRELNTNEIHWFDLLSLWFFLIFMETSYIEMIENQWFFIQNRNPSFCKRDLNGF